LKPDTEGKVSRVTINLTWDQDIAKARNTQRRKRRSNFKVTGSDYCFLHVYAYVTGVYLSRL